MLLYRVHWWIPTASIGQNGHPLYVWPQQTSGRITNMGHYQTLYAADSPAGAVAETFGNFAVWSDGLLKPPGHIPDGVRAISEISGDFTFVDLDNVSELSLYGIKPSRVVTRYYKQTQAWALSIFKGSSGDGIKWWSYHDPDWSSFGLWNYTNLVVTKTTLIDSNSPAVIQAGAMLNRSWR